MRRAILLILVLTLAVTGQASASGTDVLRDCTDDGQLRREYTQRELRSALANIPSDVDEYTDCRDVIKSAQVRLASGGGSGSTGGDATGGSDLGGATGGVTGSTPGATADGGVDAGGSSADADGGTATAGDDDNPPTGASSGDFGGFSGYEEDPLEAASAEEQQAVAEAIAARPASAASGPFANVDLPPALWIVLAVAAAGLVALAATDLRRRVVARRLR